MEIKTIQAFKKLSPSEKLTYVLSQCETTADKLLAMWLAEIEIKVGH